MTLLNRDPKAPVAWQGDLPVTNRYTYGLAGERFFRAFNRFYKVRCGFFTVISAKRELILFLLVYAFIRQPGSGKAPIESIMPEASRMPLYQLMNDPFGTVLGVENVKKNVNMADFQALECLSV